MNTYDLLELIGDTPEEYVLDAGGLGQKTPAKKHIAKKILLIAAIVAAMSLLMGSAITRLIALHTEKVTLQVLPSNPYRRSLIASTATQGVSKWSESTCRAYLQQRYWSSKYMDSLHVTHCTPGMSRGRLS